MHGGGCKSMIDDCEIQNETFSRERQQSAARRTCSVIKIVEESERPLRRSRSTRAQDAFPVISDPVHPARTESVSRLWRLQSLLPTSPLLSSLDSWGEGWVYLGKTILPPYLTSPLLSRLLLVGLSDDDDVYYSLACC